MDLQHVLDYVIEKDVFVWRHISDFKIDENKWAVSTILNSR